MRALAMFGCVALASSAAASPPPPPPTFIDDLAKQLVPTQRPETLDNYAGVLADDLTVTIDGKSVAANKNQWLAVVRARLGKVDRFVYGFAEGRDNILIFDRFDDQTDEHAQPAARASSIRATMRAPSDMKSEPITWSTRSRSWSLTG